MPFDFVRQTRRRRYSGVGIRRRLSPTRDDFDCPSDKRDSAGSRIISLRAATGSRERPFFFRLARENAEVSLRLSVPRHCGRDGGRRRDAEEDMSPLSFSFFLFLSLDVLSLISWNIPNSNLRSVIINHGWILRALRSTRRRLGDERVSSSSTSRARSRHSRTRGNAIASGSRGYLEPEVKVDLDGFADVRGTFRWMREHA